MGSSSWCLRWPGASYTRFSEPAPFEKSSTGSRTFTSRSITKPFRQATVTPDLQKNRQADGQTGRLRVNWQRAHKADLTYRARVQENAALFEDGGELVNLMSL